MKEPGVFLHAALWKVLPPLELFLPDRMAGNWARSCMTMSIWSEVSPMRRGMRKFRCQTASWMSGTARAPPWSSPGPMALPHAEPWPVPLTPLPLLSVAFRQAWPVPWAVNRVVTLSGSGAAFQAPTDDNKHQSMKEHALDAGRKNWYQKQKGKILHGNFPMTDSVVCAWERRLRKRDDKGQLGGLD